MQTKKLIGVAMLLSGFFAGLLLFALIPELENFNPYIFKIGWIAVFLFIITGTLLNIK